MFLFADDTNINGEFSEENYDLDLNSIKIWIATKNFMMNRNKTKIIVFRSKKKSLIKIRGNVLKTENDIRYLGVQIDRNLSLTEHIRNVKNRCAKIV